MKKTAVLLVAVLFIFSCQHHENISNHFVSNAGCAQPPDCEIAIYNCGFPAVKAYNVAAQSAKTKHSQIQKLYSEARQPQQLFSVKPDADTVVIAEAGTKLSIAANTFVYEDTNEPVTEEVKLSVTEYYAMADILLSHLTTVTADGEILETGGMIYVIATADGRNLKVKPGESIEISFNPAGVQEGMQLFTGVQNEQGAIKWNVISDFVSDFQYLPGWTGMPLNNVPVYPGGFRKFMKYLSERIEYPEQLFDNGIQGSVIVTFTLDRGGRIRETRVLERDHEALSKVVLAAIDSMPVWQSGYYGAKVTLPVTFGYGGQYNYAFHKITIAPVYISEEQTSSAATFKYARQKRVCDLSNYVFSTTQLGWINCDRFYNFEGERTNFFVNAGHADDADVKMVFHRIKSVVTAEQPERNSFAFTNIPAGEKVTIVGFKYENGKVHLAISETETGKSEAMDLAFVEMTEEGLKAEMEKLNALTDASASIF